MNLSYSIELNGDLVDVNIDEHSAHDKKLIKRLSGYYIQFLRSHVHSSNVVLLERIGHSLSDDGLVDMMVKLKDTKGQEEVIKSVEELLEAYDDEPFDDYEDIEINGNQFAFHKTINIESIREKLFAVGNEVKGKKWRVELDNDGKVVLCE